MLKQIIESVMSKVGELIAACAHNKVSSIKDFELSLKVLQKDLKSLNAKAFDVEEQIKNAELLGRKKRKREVEEWLREVKSIETEVRELGTEVESAGFVSKFMSGGKAVHLNEEVDKLIEQSQHFSELLVDVCGTRGEKLLTNMTIGGAFEVNFERVWRLLVTGGVLSIGVHGMGGVGKTTLAKHINNRFIEQSLGRVFWVTVSEDFTITSLQNKIARILGVDLGDEDNEDIRAGRLHRSLSQMKNSLVILDDVWEYIDLVKVGCPFSMECCRLIITTRSLEVCRQVGCQEVIAVQKLDEDEAWKLFSETYKVVGKEIKLSPKVEEIAKSMAKLCDGLPLGIITLAGSMRGETSVHSWTNALAVLKEYGAGEVEVFKVLQYSFNRLNTKSNDQFNLFQLCFLYCSLFPEDEDIPRDELVRKLISEGLLEQAKSRKAQVNLGHCILDKLVNVCLLETSVDFFGDECVKMHDLVRCMALKISEGKYMVRAGDYSVMEIAMEEEWTKDLDKMSLMYSNISIIQDGASPNCPKLSTLLLQGNHNLEIIPVSFFGRMQRLCTLDLCRTGISMLPNSLSDLRSLKALLLEHCYNLENVPNLGNLKALRELNLSYTGIKQVPRGVEELLNLKFLSIHAPQLEVLTRGMLLKLTRLQCVRLPCHLHVSAEEIEGLKHLEEFSGRVENVHDFNCFVSSHAHETSYKIQVGSKCEEYFGRYNKVVIMSNCNLRVESVLGQDIECLTLRECEGLSKCLFDDFSRLLNDPTSLIKLRIERCGGIEFISSSSKQESSPEMSTVECIELVELEDLKGIRASPAAFSSLRSLCVYNCNKMMKLGLPTQGLVNLNFIEILGCVEILEIFEEERDVCSITLPNLKKMRLQGLPRLKSICNSKMMFSNSIKIISITKCPRLMKKLPFNLEIPLPTSLEEIEVEKEWWEALEWENPNLPHLLQPFLYFQ